MNRKMTLRCHAKINLSLDVTGKREDGYHTLESIFQSVTVYDILTVSVQDGSGIVLRCSVPGLPCDERNLAYRAAQAMLEASGKKCSHCPSTANARYRPAQDCSSQSRMCCSRGASACSTQVRSSRCPVCGCTPRSAAYSCPDSTRRCSPYSQSCREHRGGLLPVR